MTVRPIAAGNSAHKSGEERGEPWNGNAEKFNDTALTSGKEGNLAVFGGVRRETGKNTEHVRYKVYDCDNVVSNGVGFISLEIEVSIRIRYR
jgi:hypothetical protein